MQIMQTMQTISTIKPTVYLIDDDIEVLKGLQWLLDSVCLHSICFKSAAEFLQHYHPDQCGCIVTDVRMPMMSGLQLLEQLNASHNHLPVIIITGHGDIPMAVNAMKNGAVDFISKPFNDQYLLEQIQKSIAISIEQHQARANQHPAAQPVRLSQREREVMELIVGGQLNKQIAQVLNISISTVEFHRARIMKKMGARNLAQLIKTYLAMVS